MAHGNVSGHFLFIFPEPAQDDPQWQLHSK
jgi:hypothetical protein